MTEHTVLWLFAAMLAILCTASVTTRVLLARCGATPTLLNLRARVQAWWLMSAVLAAAFALGRGGTIVLFWLVSFFALREFLSLLYSRRSDYRVLVLCYYFILPLQYLLVYLGSSSLFLTFIPVYAFLFMPIAASLSGDSRYFLSRAATAQWAVMIAVYCISHIPALLNLRVPGYSHNILLLLFLVAVVQASDVLQYIWGKLFGRRKILPALSPSKTVIGTVGGVCSAALLGGALYGITPFRPAEAVAIAFLTCVMGFLGGLVMSAIKRDRGVKDWGHLIEGHGGMLDRMDSLCFAAPVFFHCVQYFWAGGH
ncbi:phosphatidate cytidylyltransferase [uncultured Cardiobacterium sp.]|mgnify:FL=1|uniref:phosphatidate cytidylyltransferase n=1 Tax=uncultured Cardiobacterium sp. TaxID=417619 RepID=UPI00263518E9|nr:phosphatidate cytidylyltransferase [uncultured Cardiobacterium sp.]